MDSRTLILVILLVLVLAGTPTLGFSYLGHGPSLSLGGILFLILICALFGLI